MYGRDHCRKAFTVLVLWESFSSTGHKAAYSRPHKKSDWQVIANRQYSNHLRLCFRLIPL